MKNLGSKPLNFLYFLYRWVAQVLDPIRLALAPIGFFKYFQSLLRYSRLPGSEMVHIIDTYPVLSEATSVTPFDAHYFHQSVWAFKHVAREAPPWHVDVGSQTGFVGILSAITNVAFVDVRPLSVDLSQFFPVKASILSLPFGDASLQSCSCLHVVEHIGLGRYGDPLDPLGTLRAVQELQRVVARGGSLLLSTPIGRPRLCFNSHRIHAPSQILEMLDGMELKEFSAVDDDGKLRMNTAPELFEGANYSCGLFLLRKL